MNYSMIFYILSSVLTFEGMFLLLPCVAAIVYGEKEGLVYLAVALVSILIGILGRRRKTENKVFYSKEGFVTVSLSWILISLVGAVPFVLTGEIPNYLDAVFETVSGFTTTGASIMNDVEILSKTSAFWRLFTHWIGGMGVLVLILAVLPISGSYNMHLMRAESPGPSVGKLVPKVKNTAKMLYSLYITITLVEIVALIVCGMPFFESLTLSFATAGTGGFALLNSSIGSYNVASQVVITIFMLLFSVNFNVYYLVYTRKYKDALKNEEMKVFFAIVMVVTLAITANILFSGIYTNILQAFQQAAFQVASVISTTGFATTDYNVWPEFSKTLLLFVMFVGACAGSTGGGIKISRVVILAKAVKNEILSIIHPRSVKRVTFEGKSLSEDMVKSVLAYLAAYVLIVIVSFILISVDNFDMTTNFSAVMAAFNNIGPGFNVVGPAGNYGGFSAFSKIVLIFDMLVGRLEIFPLLVLFSRNIYRR